MESHGYKVPSINTTNFLQVLYGLFCSCPKFRDQVLHNSFVSKIITHIKFKDQYVLICQMAYVICLPIFGIVGKPKLKAIVSCGQVYLFSLATLKTQFLCVTSFISDGISKTKTTPKKIKK
jgi:hypothetical protein